MEVLTESLAASTRKQYNTAFRSWWKYCLNKNIPMFKATPSQVIAFFQFLFRNNKFKYGSFNNFRSALSLIMSYDLGKDPVVKRYIRGISKLRPQTPRYNLTWDPQILLDFLSCQSSNELLTLEFLSKKLISLLSLTTAQRFQTFSLIRMKNVIFTNEGTVLVFIPDSIKTSGPNKKQPCLQFKPFIEQPDLCVVKTLQSYIERTVDLRDTDNEFLFISFSKPHNRVSSQTLSRWVKDVLSRAGINTNIFSAYSIKHASTSAALKRGLPINLIRKTAGWSDRSKTFLNFYNRPIVESEDMFAFADTLMKE